MYDSLCLNFQNLVEVRRESDNCTHELFVYKGKDEKEIFVFSYDEGNHGDLNVYYSKDKEFLFETIMTSEYIQFALKENCKVEIIPSDDRVWPSKYNKVEKFKVKITGWSTYLQKEIECFERNTDDQYLDVACIYSSIKSLNTDKIPLILVFEKKILKYKDFNIVRIIGEYISDVRAIEKINVN
jgi:hypothetical protein